MLRTGLRTHTGRLRNSAKRKLDQFQRELRLVGLLGSFVGSIEAFIRVVRLGWRDNRCTGDGRVRRTANFTGCARVTSVRNHVRREIFTGERACANTTSRRGSCCIREPGTGDEC
jgi:hypothetical protein